MRLPSRFRQTLSQRKSVLGYHFTLPFTIGLLFIFLSPFVKSIVFSVSGLTISPDGYDLSFLGLENFRYAVSVHPQYVRALVSTVGLMVSQLPFILAFSFFAAIVLNQRFKGRFLARVIFFLPVIMGAGVVLRMEQNDLMMSVLQSETGPGTGFLSAGGLQEFLRGLKLPERLANYIMAGVDSIPIIVRASGIQILIFLAGLQTIPRSLYEAADVEGATAWESFWMITFPMLTPLILTAIVYTIIDFFGSAQNQLVALIKHAAFTEGRFGAGSAMSTIYFAVIAVILATIVALVSRFVFYHER